jgi:hypothetical protein
MPERRESSRFPLEKPCLLSIEGREVNAQLENLSDKGGLFRIVDGGSPVVSNEDLGREASFVLSSVTASRTYAGEIIRLYFAEGAWHIAVRFWKSFRGRPA